MENRLELNKKEELEYNRIKIDNVIIKEYRKNIQVPDFIPDICICNWGNIKECKPFEYTKQIWIKSNDKELIEFIRGYNFNDIETYKNSSKSIPMYIFKKVIKEEYYGE